MKRILRNKEFISGLIFLAIGLFFFMFSFGIKITDGYLKSSRLLPQMASMVMVATSIIICISSMHKEREKNTKLEQKICNDEQKSTLKVDFVFALLLSYFLLLETVGFILASILFFVGMVNILHNYGERKQRHYIVVSVITVLIIFCLFSYVFGISLPAGRLF